MSDLRSEVSFDDTIINDSLDSATQSILEISDDEVEKSNVGPVRSNKKPNPSSSEINEFFIRSKDSQRCLMCSKIYGGIGTTSTGTLKTHLRRKHPIEYHRKFTQDTLRVPFRSPHSQEKTKHIIDWIITSMQPFSVVEEDYFVEMLKNLDPRYCVPNREYIKKCVLKRFENCREKLKYSIGKINNKISLAIDLWTSDDNHTSFLGVTCHYIDDDWTLRRFLLDIVPFRESHSGLNMAQTLTNLLSEFNLSTKVLALTTESSTAMIICGNEMKNVLNDTFNNPDFSHFRCGGHILNIAVQYGLRIHDVSIEKVRNFIIIVQNSDKLLMDLRHICVSQSIEFLLPQLDSSIHWNSTYLMINMMNQIKVQANILMAHHHDEFKDNYLDNNDWNNLRELLSVLSPFYSATLSLSSSVYPTIGDLRFTFWTLKQHLQNEIVNNRTQYLVADSILQKLNEYWNIVDDTTLIASLLDPRTKCSIFTQEESTKAINIIEKKMDSYIQNYNNITTRTAMVTISNQAFDARAHLLSLANRFRPTTQSDSNNELEKYLLLPQDEDCDPLMWWNSYQRNFPILSSMAKDYISIQSTSASCEQVFGLTNSKLKNQLDPETARVLICLKSWISEKIVEYDDMSDPDTNERTGFRF